MILLNKKNISLAVLALFSSTLFAKTPDVMAYENILKQDINQEQTATKIPTSTSQTLPPPPANIPVGVAPTSSNQMEFNVIGTMSVNGKNTAWLISKENKLIRVAEGVGIEGKTITAINQYGVKVKSQSQGTLFMPVMTTQVNESDVVFNQRTPMATNTNNTMTTNNTGMVGR